jgi:hypothetical protein
MMNTQLKVSALMGGLLASVSAFAAVDITSVSAGVTDATTAVGTIGLAVLGIFIGIKAYKWVRRAL